MVAEVIALAIIYSPGGPVMTVPRDQVMAMVVTYDPPRRPAPACNVRPASLDARQVALLAALLDPKPGSDR